MRLTIPLALASSDCTSMAHSPRPDDSQPVLGVQGRLPQFSPLCGHPRWDRTHDSAPLVSEFAHLALVCRQQPTVDQVAAVRCP